MGGWVVPAPVLSMISLNPPKAQRTDRIILVVLVTEHKFDEVSHFVHNPHCLKELAMGTHTSNPSIWKAKAGTQL